MMWRQEKQDQNYDPEVPITRLLNDGVRTDKIVHDERGQVYCVWPETKEQRDMVFCGFEKDRKSLKYSCPAAIYDLECKGYRECHQLHGEQVSDYGRVVCVKLDKNRRIFTPTPRHTVSPNVSCAVDLVSFVKSK